jgi:hypothetical protein
VCCNVIVRAENSKNASFGCYTIGFILLQQKLKV